MPVNLFTIARRLGRNGLQEVVGMLWGLLRSNHWDTMTSRLQSPIKVHLVWSERV